LRHAGPGIPSWGGLILHTVNGYPTLTDSSGSRRLAETHSWAGQGPYILEWNGRLYITGAPWFRINPETWEAEAMESERVPVSSAKWGVSRHHGMICWGKSGDFYRVVIKDKPQDGPATLSPGPQAAGNGAP